MQRISNLEHKGLDKWSEFFIIINEELIKIVLREVHDDHIWLDRPYQKTKDEIKDMIGLCRSTNWVPIINLAKNKEV